ncbi:mitogen-activated protein kinase kinase kinase 3-like [Iris pallida]|uniref:Mitogen-activated protein kinase kinase kinase 3-like n=1 Tax=Iris pallida TaxID=29817 RepID=A0AAX6ET48_IRIPA|nr:mitogen-activated protein kinase kinase kinase 3-like [Iris pallida]
METTTTTQSQMAWLRGPTIGRGSSATVSLAVANDGTDRVFAAKSAPVSTSHSLWREESILDDLKQCPRIINCFGHDVDGRFYNLFLEFFPRGSLHDSLRHSSGSFFPEPTARRYTRSVLKALQFVHARGYVHCDVKLRNILLCDDGDVKIADFGLARKAKGKEDEEDVCSISGTPMYMSPESVARREYEAPMDIWAVGCALAEMVSGRPPWQGRLGYSDDVWALLMRIGFGDEDVEIPTKISEPGKDFLRRCLVRDPEKRWTADMLLNHPFLAEPEPEPEPELEPELKDDDRCCLEEWLRSPKSVLHSSPSETSLCFSSSGSSEAGTSSPADRIRILATGKQPDWWRGSSSDENWISVREVA